jgi:hypothetical protein
MDGGLPSICDRRGVEKGFVECDKAFFAAAGFYTLDDGLVGGRGEGWRVGDVGETHGW